MAFIVTGAYIAVLFGAGMWFVWRHRGKAKTQAQGAGNSGGSGYAHEERRQGERRHGVPA